MDLVDYFITKTKAAQIYESIQLDLDNLPEVLGLFPQDILSQGSKALCEKALQQGYHPYHAVDSTHTDDCPDIILLGTAKGKVDFAPLLETLVKDGFCLASEGFDEDVPIMAYGLSSMQGVVNRVAKKYHVPIVGIDNHNLLVAQQRYIRDMYRQESDRDRIHKAINAFAARESHHFSSCMDHAQRNERPTVFVLDDMHIVSPILADGLEKLKVHYISFVTPLYKKGQEPIDI